MKNYLVILVTIGMGVAYWYQIPEPPKAPVVVETPAPPPQRFVAARSALDEPPRTVGGGHASNSVLLGNDKPSHLHP